MNPFTKHPAEAGETYWQHFRFASSVARQALAAGFAAGIHAFLPFTFQRTAGGMLLGLAERIRAARPQRGSLAAAPDEETVA